MAGERVTLRIPLPLAQRNVPRLLGSRRKAVRCAAEQDRKENMSLSDILSFEVQCPSCPRVIAACRRTCLMQCHTLIPAHAVLKANINRTRREGKQRGCQSKSRRNYWQSGERRLVIHGWNVYAFVTRRQTLYTPLSRHAISQEAAIWHTFDQRVRGCEGPSGGDNTDALWHCSPKHWRLLAQHWKPKGSSRLLSRAAGTSSTQATGDTCPSIFIYRSEWLRTPLNNPTQLRMLAKHTYCAAKENVLQQKGRCAPLFLLCLNPAVLLAHLCPRQDKYLPGVDGTASCCSTILSIWGRCHKYAFSAAL